MSEVQYECSMCGRDGGPSGGCTICHGAERFRVEAKGHYLSDVKSGRVKEASRYGLDGDVGPRTHDPLWAGAERPY